MKGKFKIIFNLKLNEKQNKMKMTMAYGCHSIPADFAKRDFEAREETGNGLIYSQHNGCSVEEL